MLKAVILALLLLAAYTLPTLESGLELKKCLDTCKVYVEDCLQNSVACEKAYGHCLTTSNFVGCIQSANGLKMQSLFRCL